MNSFPIREIDLGDQTKRIAALSLLNETLGDKLYNEQTLLKVTEKETLLVAAYDEEKMVGIAMAGKLDQTGVDFYTPFGPEAVVRLKGNTIGVLRNSGVKSNYRGRGIGTALLAERLRWLKQTGCDYAIGVTWMHGQTTQSDQLFRSAGMKQLGPTVPEFYKSISQKTGLVCPYCGFPCLCPGALFIKKL